MAFALHIEPFIASDADPGGTLSRFTRYVERMKQLFQLVFRKGDGWPYNPPDAEKRLCCSLEEEMTCRVCLIMLER